jgi:hypothetical protein
MTLEVSAQSLWIIEGIYGWLAEVAFGRATALLEARSLTYVFARSV